MANVYYLGAAVKTPEVKHFLVNGVWAAADTLYVEINGKRLTLTVDTSTVDTIIQEAAAMINGTAAVGTETRSALGNTVGEFNLLTASYDTTNDHLILTGPADGRSIGTVSVGETTAGSGAIAAAVATDITGTGPHHFNDADNWSAAPSNGDNIYFDHRAASACKYGLDQSALTPASVTITPGFRYSIGLAAVNKDNSTAFDEFFEQYLTFAGGGTVIVDGSGGGMIKVDTGTAASTITINGSGTTAEQGRPPVLIEANHASSSISVVSGHAGLNLDLGSTGQVASAHVGGGASPSLDIGSGVTIASLTNNAGQSSADVAITTVTCTGGTHVQLSGAITTANVYNAGKLKQQGSGTITTLSLVRSTLDCSENIVPRTVTNCSVYSGSTVKDPSGSVTFTNGLDLYCKPQNVILDLISHKTYTISGI